MDYAAKQGRGQIAAQSGYPSAAAGYIGGALVGGTSLSDACQMKHPECQPSREVPEQMERLDKALYFAQESLQELIVRLDPLIRPNAPETDGCGVAGAPVATQHGGALFGFGSRAGSLGERIQDLLRRLEV